MAGQIHRRVFNAGLRQVLAAFTGRQVGLAEPPSATPTLPYVIITPMVSPRGTGSFFDPEEDHQLVFSILSVGRDAEQCAWMHDKVYEGMLGRNAQGNYLMALVIEGVNVQYRCSDSIGAIVPSGDQLFQCADTYRLTVGA